MPCKVIYVPKGKAFEYCPLAVNLFRGCSHACSYCYVPGISYQTKESFSIPIPRKDIIEKIRKEAPAHRGHKVSLCFTCDPYQKAHDHLKLPAKAISALHDGGAFVSILTKSGMLSAQDFPLLGRGDEYGATLTFIKKEDSDRWEPGAASPIERIEALEKAHAAGIPTWASIEPVIDPAQSLELIRITHPIVDVFKIGKWNHDTRANLIDWKSFAMSALELVNKYNKKHLIKKDLAAYLP